MVLKEKYKDVGRNLDKKIRNKIAGATPDETRLAGNGDNSATVYDVLLRKRHFTLDSQAGALMNVAKKTLISQVVKKNLPGVATNDRERRGER